MDGLAAGRITFVSFLIPCNSSVAALSKYRLSIVIIPVIVAKSVDHTVPYTIRNKDATQKLGDNNKANGDRRIDGITLNI